MLDFLFIFLLILSHLWFKQSNLSLAVQIKKYIFLLSIHESSHQREKKGQRNVKGEESREELASGRWGQILEGYMA